MAIIDKLYLNDLRQSEKNIKKLTKYCFQILYGNYHPSIFASLTKKSYCLPDRLSYNQLDTLFSFWIIQKCLNIVGQPMFRDYSDAVQAIIRCLLRLVLALGVWTWASLTAKPIKALNELGKVCIYESFFGYFCKISWFCEK